VRNQRFVRRGCPARHRFNAPSGSLGYVGHSRFLILTRL
jgi:hypothetical protein